MTIEEKAKAYDEALERIKKYYDMGSQPSHSDLECIFPQLRESEDERTRKRAIAILKQQRDYWSYDGPIDKFPPATPRKDLVDAIDVALSYLEKQKEQKPAWSEEDKLWLSEIYFAIDHSMYSEDERQAMKKYIDSLRYQSQPKPAEWSEDDEKMRNLAIEWAETMSGQFSFVGMDSTDFRKITTWLKSLRPSWKPSEEQMQEAVEGEVYKFGEVAYVKECNNAELTKYLSRFNNGDKVKIIVIHETDIR